MIFKKLFYRFCGVNKYFCKIQIINIVFKPISIIFSYKRYQGFLINLTYKRDRNRFYLDRMQSPVQEADRVRVNRLFRSERSNCIRS